MKTNIDRKLVLAASSLCALCAAANVKLAEPFSDGAVLQRRAAVPVWGTAAPGEKVTVSFAGASATATAGADGAWRADLPPLEASAEGRTLSAKGDRSSAAAEAKDVLVGEVWFCCGQSNAELPFVGDDPRFRDAKGAMRAQATNRPEVRFCYQSSYTISPEPKRRCAAKVQWKAFTPENLSGGESFSAMGVYFALELNTALRVPVGIVGAYWGATRIEPWTPKSGLESVAETAGLAEMRLLAQEAVPKSALGSIPLVRRYAESPAPAGSLFKRLNDQPSVAWNEMVAPWTPYAIKGFIWYQGCANAREGMAYVPKMHALYNGWSREFGNPGLSLCFVQLAPWGFDGIAGIQMAQARFAAEQPNARMAVINDRGNLRDIHPNDKETVGQRLAMLALEHDYGMAIEGDSPSFSSCRVDGSRLVVEFANARSLYVYNPDRSLDTGLEVCGADGGWKRARILNFDGRGGSTGSRRGAVAGPALLIAADGVDEPKRVRYLHSAPWFGAIYNEANLPLGAFEAEAAPEAPRPGLSPASPVETVPHELDMLIKAGHIQGACCDESGIYLSHQLGIVKIGWDGRKIAEAKAPAHLGDSFAYKGRVYGAFGLRRARDGMRGWIGVWDAATLQMVDAKPVQTNCIDGLAVLNDTIYYGVDYWGHKPHYEAAIGTADLSLRKTGEKRIDFGFKINYGVQTMATDGESLFMCNYIDDKESNPKRHSIGVVSPSLELVRTLRFGASEGFCMVPPAVFPGREHPVFFRVEALGGNMQGWRRDPEKNPPRIRIAFFEYVDGEFTAVRK